MLHGIVKYLPTNLYLLGNSSRFENNNPYNLSTFACEAFRASNSFSDHRGTRVVERRYQFPSVLSIAVVLIMLLVHRFRVCALKRLNAQCIRRTDMSCF